MAGMLVRANTRQERLVLALQAQVTVDALTGLVTRRAFDGALGTTLTGRTPGGTALVLIDVDAFKTVNDAYGHPVGDALLVHLAGCCAGRSAPRTPSCRGSAATSSPCCCPTARRMSPPAAPRSCSPRCAPLPSPCPTARCSGCRSASGVAHVTGPTRDLESLYHSADVALYEAKRAGRGRVAVAAG